MEDHAGLLLRKFFCFFLFFFRVQASALLAPILGVVLGVLARLVGCSESKDPTKTLSTRELRGPNWECPDQDPGQICCGVQRFCCLFRFVAPSGSWHKSCPELKHSRRFEAQCGRRRLAISRSWWDGPAWCSSQVDRAVHSLTSPRSVKRCPPTRCKMRLPAISKPFRWCDPIPPSALACKVLRPWKSSQHELSL